MFIYEGNIKKIKEATKLANEILVNPEFYKMIEDKNSFDMATCSPKEISKAIQEIAPLMNINVKTYRRRFSRALAYFTKSRPYDININTAKLNRSLASIVATCIHEMVHMVDDVVDDQYFGHGNNSRKGKQNTAPYYLDSIAQGLVSGRFDFNDNSSSNIIYKKSIIKRIKSFFRRVF